MASCCVCFASFEVILLRDICNCERVGGFNYDNSLLLSKNLNCRNTYIACFGCKTFCNAYNVQQVKENHDNLLDDASLRILSPLTE